MGYFYYLRHGKTLWNNENKICGCTDIGLSDEGKTQAISVGNMIKEHNIGIDVIISSPLRRASETASIISDITGIPMKSDQRLREQSFGCYEGGYRSDQAFISKRRQFAYRFENGESLFMVIQRVYDFLDDLCANIGHDKTVLVVSHNAISRIVYSYFNDVTNDEFYEYGVPNCELIQFNF